jgi:hypothetical protein
MFSDTRDPEPPRSHAGGQVSHPASRIAPPSRDRALYASHAGAESASAALALGGDKPSASASLGGAILARWQP